MEIFPIFITIVGFILGLGAVMVLDIEGYLGRTSTYWAEATIRSHKIIKYFIWIGIAFVSVGGVMMKNLYIMSFPEFSLWTNITLILLANGVFLSFFIGPELVKIEKAGLAEKLLPKHLEYKVLANFLLSFIGWWSLLFLFIEVIR